MSAGSEVRVVLMTAPDVETGERLAQALVEARLAACVNVVRGVRSIYRWEGRIERGEEVLLLAKTRADRTAALAQRVAELHPYEVPEVVELAGAGGSSAYLDWVRTETSP